MSTVVEFLRVAELNSNPKKKKKKSSSCIHGLQKSSDWVVVVQWTSNKCTKQVFFACKDAVLPITPRFILRFCGSPRRGILSSLSLICLSVSGSMYGGRRLKDSIGTLSKDDDGVSENVAKKMNLRSFKLNRDYLDPLNMSNAGDFFWS